MKENKRCVVAILNPEEMELSLLRTKELSKQGGSIDVLENHDSDLFFGKKSAVLSSMKKPVFC